jgi:hypothetical protein
MIAAARFKDFHFLPLQKCTCCEKRMKILSFLIYGFDPEFGVHYIFLVAQDNACT